jgi:hypothetical protein
VGDVGLRHRICLALRVAIVVGDATVVWRQLYRKGYTATHTMEPSPLTQDSRPEIFQPKIIRLYETLFKVRAHQHHTTTANAHHRRTMRRQICPMASGRSSFCTGRIPQA